MTTIQDVRAAAERIRNHVHRTPVLTSTTLDRELGAEVFVKCENLQKIGAFKARGACNAVMARSVSRKYFSLLAPALSACFAAASSNRTAADETR